MKRLKGVGKFVNGYVTKKRNISLGAALKEEHFAKRCWEIRQIGAALKEEHFAKRCWEIRQIGAALKEEHFAKRCWEIRQIGAALKEEHKVVNELEKIR